MNFLNLHYFLVTAEEMNITKAAGRLYISQQALSNHISNLEKEFGTPLFVRSPGLHLTYAGKCLVYAGKQITSIRHQLDIEMEDITGRLRGELRIGISFTRGQALLPHVLPMYKEKHPLVKIALKEDNAANLEQLLRRSEIDLLISTDTTLPNVAECLELTQERLFLVVPVKFLHAAYGAKTEEKRASFRAGVHLAEFGSLPFIMLKRGDRVRLALDEALYQAGISPNILLETDNIQTAFSLADTGMGMTVYPEMFLQNRDTVPGTQWSSRVDCFPVLDLKAETLFVGYSRFQKLSRAAEDFISLLQETFANGRQVQEAAN